VIDWSYNDGCKWLTCGFNKIVMVAIRRIAVYLIDMILRYYEDR